VGELVPFHVLERELVPERERLAVHEEDVAPLGVLDAEVVAQRKELLLHEVTHVTPDERAIIAGSSTLPPVSPRIQLAWLSLSMFLGMTLWFSATAATAAIVAEFHLTAGDAAWLTMAVQGGFVIGTLLSAVLNLPDV